MTDRIIILNKKFNKFASLLWKYAADYGRVAVSSDGSHLAIGAANKVYLLNKKEKIWVYETDNKVKSISVSPDGSYIAIGSSNNVYLLTKEKKLLWIDKTYRDVISVSISSEGSYIAIGSSNNVYLLTKEKKPLWNYETSSWVQVSISYGGSHIAAGSSNNIYFLENLSKRGKNRKWRYDIPEFNIVTGVSVSADGSYIAIGFSNKIYILSKDGEFLWKYEIGLDDIESIAMSSDGSYIGVGSSNNVYLLRNLNNEGKLLWSYETDSKVMSISVSSDGSYIAAGSIRYIYFFKCDIEHLHVEHEKIKNSKKRSGDSSPEEVPIDSAIFKKAIMEDPVEVEKVTETILLNNYDHLMAMNLLNSFRIILKVIKNCSLEKFDEMKDNLNLLVKALERAGVGKDITNMVKNYLIIIGVRDNAGASIEQVNKFCENILESWMIEFLNDSNMNVKDMTNIFNIYGNVDRVNIKSTDKSTNITGDLLADLESLRVLIERDYKRKDKSEMVKTVDQMKGSCDNPSKKSWLRERIEWIITKTSEISSISSFAMALLKII